MNKESGVVEQLEKKDYNRKKLVITIVCIVLAFAILISTTWLVFAFAAPKKLAKFAYNCNMENYALKLYKRDYKKSGDINTLYTILCIEIKHENDAEIVSNFEEFYKNPNYYDFVEKVNEENLKADTNELVKASLLNEDNYLKNKYIKSLIATNKIDKAFDFACEDAFILNPTYNNFGNYLFDGFCNETVLKTEGVTTKFNVAKEKYNNESVIVAIEEYFENLNTEFVNKYLEVEKKYAWGMGNRILQVGKNLLELYKFNDIGGTRDSANVENVMNNVVTKFQILNMR